MVVKSQALRVGIAWGRGRIPFSGTLLAAEVACLCKPYSMPGAVVAPNPVVPKVWSPDVQPVCWTCKCSSPTWDQMNRKLWGRPRDACQRASQSHVTDSFRAGELAEPSGHPLRAAVITSSRVLEQGPQGRKAGSFPSPVGGRWGQTVWLYDCPAQRGDCSGGDGVTGKGP